MKKTSTSAGMRMLLGAVAAILLAACASIGNPEGGPIDETPPVFVKSNPLPGQLRVDRNKIIIEFDENVQIKDALGKVTVSPAQKTPPQVSAVGRRVTVELRDTMLPNTTYTIDFADAISDLNEGNEIDGFAVDFATGDTIDTLCVSGMVFEAATLEPAQGMLVGVYSNLSDTAVRTLPLERITKTNQFGQFTVRNLKPGTYRIYAINDVNRDYKWDRSEDVAFYPLTISPTTQPTTVTDTLRASDGRDSLVTRPATRYLPDDILLTWFNENYKNQYLAKYERPARERFTMQFGAPSDTLPVLHLLNGSRPGLDLSTVTVLNGGPTRDTLEYWITDPEVLALDTLLIEAKFLRTDTLDQLTWGTDTLTFNLKGLKKKKKQEEKEKAKEQTDTAASDSVPQPKKFLAISIASGANQDLNKPLVLKTEVPIGNLDAAGVHLEKAITDSTWEALPAPVFVPVDSFHPMMMKADYKWEPGEKYRLTIDSLAMTDIYGVFNKDKKHLFETRKFEDYATVTFNLKGVQGAAVAQLLNEQDKPVAVAEVKNGQAVFRFIQPGVYYARLWLDANNNGIYDGGLLDSIQPEEMFYLSKKLNLKKNWEVAQEWDIYELPLDLQKPEAIKKNKPKEKPGDRKDREEEEEYEEYDPNDPFGTMRGNSNFNNRNNNRNNNLRNPFGGGGGLMQNAPIRR